MAHQFLSDDTAYRRLFVAAPTPLLVLAPDVPRFTIVDVNDAYLATTMTTREGLIGRGMFEAFPSNPDDAAADGVSNLRVSLQRALATRGPDAMPVQKYDIARQDGTFEQRWWDPVNTPVLDDGGDVEAIIHYVTDVTKEHRAEAAFRANDLRLRGVLDGMAEGFSLLAPDFTILEQNNEAVRLGGRSREAVVGRSHWDAYPGSEHSEIGQLYKRATAERTPVSLEHRYAFEGGAVRWLDTRAYPTADGGLAVFWRDVTDRKEAEERVRESEARHRQTLKISTVGVVYFDFVGGISDANDGFLNLIGYSREELEAGKVRYENLTPPDWAWRDERTITELKAEGSSGPFEKEYFRRDGSRMCLLCASKTLDEHSAVEFIIDLTARKAAEAVLHENVARAGLRLDLTDALQTLTMPSEMMAAVARSLGQFLDVDQANYYEIRGDSFTVAEEWRTPTNPGLIGTHSLTAFGENTIARMHAGEVLRLNDTRGVEGVDAFAAAGMAAVLSVPARRDGRWAAGLHIHQRKPRTWTDDEVALVREISAQTWAAVERIRAEERLHALNETLENLVDQRTAERDRIWITSRDLITIVGTDGIVREVNPAWTTILGYQPDELVGRHVLDPIFPEDTAISRAALDDTIETGVLDNFENRYAHKDGTIRWFSWTTTGEGDLLYAFGRDVTAEKDRQAELGAAQEALRQAQKMEAVGQLTGGLAHDFNNLLAGISGSLELMQTRISQGRFGDIDRYIKVAQGATKRAAALTHRLLAFSRRQTLEPKTTNINRLIAEMEELIRRTIGPEIAFEVVGTAGLWSALIDPGQLENALLNLCINARDAMPDGGRITIETANKWLDRAAATQHEIPEGQYLSVCVTDTGTGMPPDVIARVFEPFFTTKPIGQGTGLGLSMIYGFAKQSGGQVRIYSEVGLGTTVCLYLPRHYGDVDADEAVPKLANVERVGQGETVLVVDDEPTVRMLVTEVLEDLGYTAIEAADSATGLKVLQSDVRIDLLVTDVGLPGGMNGRQMADAGRVSRPGLTVLFITGYAENAMLSNGHLEPGMQVLTKPFAMDALTVRIRELVEIH